MLKIEIHARTVTPVLLGGAGRPSPESVKREGIRVAGLRGQMAFWLRAFAGYQENRLPEIQRIQSAIMGSIGVSPSRSPVQIRTYCDPFQPIEVGLRMGCLLYTSPSPRDRTRSRMPSSA